MASLSSGPWLFDASVLEEVRRCDVHGGYTDSSSEKSGGSSSFRKLVGAPYIGQRRSSGGCVQLTISIALRVSFRLNGDLVKRKICRKHSMLCL